MVCDVVCDVREVYGVVRCTVYMARCMVGVQIQIVIVGKSCCKSLIAVISVLPIPCAASFMKVPWKLSSLGYLNRP